MRLKYLYIIIFIFLISLLLNSSLGLCEKRRDFVPPADLDKSVKLETNNSKKKPIGYYNYILYKTFGRYGTSRGYFDNPIDISIDTSYANKSANDIYIVDYGNRRIQKFDYNGDYIKHWEWETWDKPNSDLSILSLKITYPKNTPQITIEENSFKPKYGSKIKPSITIANIDLFEEANIYFMSSNNIYTDIITDLENNIYVVDNKSCYILKFKKLTEDEKIGDYICNIGGFGSGEGYFYSPTKIAFDSSKFGSIWVLDSKNGHIQNFDLNGEFIKSIEPYDATNKKLKEPTDLCIDNHGFIFVSDASSHKIYKYNNSGVYIQSIGSYGSDPGQFINPKGIAIDNDGKIYIVDSGNNRIQIFRPTTALN